MRNRLRFVVKLFGFFALTCASICAFAQAKQNVAANTSKNDVQGSQQEYVAQEDPLEPFNRQVYLLNDGIDKVIIHPLAVYYDNAFPWPVKKGVSNFFYNLEEVPNIANDILQFNLGHMVNDVWRLVFNTTIGVGGLFDFASRVGLKRNHEDFGLTLAAWGFKKSPYLVVPFFGPETIRDALGIPVDIVTSVIFYANPPRDMYILKGIKIVETRANLLRTDEILKDAFDPYVLVRNAYLQRRAHLMSKNDHLEAKMGDEDDR
jgi:phospholipid-binding lipoprotein MlaA